MLTFDFSAFRRFERKLDDFQRQVPFALSLALNASAEVARKEIIDQTWAQHVTVRNPNFLKAALSTNGTRATKHRLRVEVYDRLNRASLKLHDTGGTKRPKGTALAVPMAAIAGRAGARGVPKGLRPRNLPNSFSKVGKRGETLIFQRTGKYQKAAKGAVKKAKRKGEKRPKGVDNRHLKLAYVLKPSVPIHADVPFQSDFARTMRREMPRQFSTAMRRAIATSFKR